MSPLSVFSDSRKTDDPRRVLRPPVPVVPENHVRRDRSLVESPVDDSFQTIDQFGAGAGLMSESLGNSAQIQLLLDQASQDNDASYDEVIALASDRLVRLTRRMLRNDFSRLRRWEQTDDVFQNAAIRLHRSLVEVKPDSVRGLYGLANEQIRRSLLDLVRHHFGLLGPAAHHYSDGFGKPDEQTDKPQQAGSDDDQPETLQEWAEFHEAVGQLPDAEREVFELTFYAGLPQAQIASLLSISIPTVKRRLRSAKEKLYDALHGESPLDGGL